jgi:biopolymer transport protein ExbB
VVPVTDDIQPEKRVNLNNDYGLINLWLEGDGVTRFVALLLLAMSLASWIVILLKTLNLLTARKQAARIEAFWHSADVNTGLKTLGDEADNPFRQLAQQGMQALAHLKTSSAQADLAKQLDTSDWVTRGLQNAIDDATAR